MFVMNSNDKGAIAEEAIVFVAMKLGVRVWRPASEHGRADLVFDVGGELLRVQVKWGQLTPAADRVIVRVGTCRCTPHGYVRGTYGDHEVDLFGVYCGELDRCFLLPVSLVANRTSIALRLTPPRNGQESCINLADDFTFDGAVAQLARASGWQPEGQGFESPQLHLQQAKDSGPRAHAQPSFGATERRRVAVNADAFRARLGHWIDRVGAGESLLVSRRGKAVMRVDRPVS
jgi:PD-(D/E)XK endonuclease